MRRMIVHDVGGRDPPFSEEAWKEVVVLSEVVVLTCSPDVGESLDRLKALHKRVMDVKAGQAVRQAVRVNEPCGSPATCSWHT